MKKNIRGQLIMASKRILYGFIFQLFFCTVLLANTGNAQRKDIEKIKVKMSVQNTPLELVFASIEQQTGLGFTYNSANVDVKQEVDVKVSNKTVYNLLTELSTDTGLRFIQINDNIHVKSYQQGVIKNVSIENSYDLEITGKIVDESGYGIPGVTVIIEGTTRGTVTDVDGNYSISAEEGEVLVFSFIGFVQQKIAISNQSTIDIVLQEDQKTLDEVVVVGYGEVKKSDLTGSIVSVKADDIADLPVNSIAETLQGRVAGVMVNKSSGKPGAGSEIIIRGVGSINGLNPLFIIDGINRGNNVTYNPKDVESIEIIKDASAAAIYGAQAAGGVVLITTKKGSFNQKTEINVSSNYGVRQISNSYTMLETEPYIEARRAIGDNYGLWDNPSQLPNTNWFDELYQTGIEQSHIVSITGGTEKSNFYVSAGYDSEEGIVKSNKWERFSIRANSDFKLGDKVTVGTKLYGAKTMENPYAQNVPWRSLPYMPVYNEDGSFASVPAEVDFSGGNDVASLSFNHRKTGSALFNADVFLDWQILKDLKFRTLGSAGISTSYSDNFVEEDNLRRAVTPASYTKSSWYSEAYTWTTTLTYDKIFNTKHEFRALIGYEVKSSNQSSLAANANSFPVEVAESFALSTNSNKTASGSLTYGKFLSQFARVNYNYDDRYLLTANIRRDGSPKFGPSNRWGVFPSISAGWKINEENFFKNLGADWISLLKPRVSWGILGNDAALSNFSYINSYKPVTFHSFDEETSISGYNSIKVINQDIKWEEIHTINYGIDLYLFDSRLSVSAEVYNRNTKDMIYNLPIPPSAGIGERNLATSTLPVNIGSIVNKGWELSVNYRNTINDFRYNIGANLSHNTNKVTDLGLPNAYIYSGSGSFPFAGTSPFKTINGLPVGQIYGFQTDGLITDQSQIDQLNNIAKESYAASTGKDPSDIYYHKSLTGPGDLLFKDLDGDGRITDSDRTIIGNPWAKYQYGFNVNLGWKNFDLIVDVFGVSGRDVFNSVKSNEESFAQDYQSTDKIFDASFSFGNGLTDQPALGQINPANGAFVKDPNLNYRTYSDYFVEDGSYTKIKNITIGYTLPKHLLASLNIQHVRILVTGQNLFTFTKFSGLDPEFSNDVKNHGLYTFSTYPQTKLYSIGLDLTL